jgi:two-component system, OmpR family, phosphate regulon response regulator OmpR
MEKPITPAAVKTSSSELSPDRRDLIALVEDDARLRDLLERYLVQQGFRVRAVANLAGLNALVAAHHLDLIVLDLNLPDGHGLHACRDLRAKNIGTPIIMLTAQAEEIDRIIGLEMGADDYLAKPANPRELLARIRSVLRRLPPPSPSLAQSDAPIRFADCVFDPIARTLTRSGTPTVLTSGEFALLQTFLRHPKRALTRDQLLNLSRGRDYASTDRSIDVMVAKLRRLIEPNAKQPRFLQTVWGKGYAYVPELDAATIAQS